MPLVPVLHPYIKRPLVFGWPADVPLPSLTSDGFDLEPLYPLRVLQIVIGPYMDQGADAALRLLLSTPFCNEVDCVSVVFHLLSFNTPRFQIVQEYVAPATMKEIRVINPALHYENTTISSTRDGKSVNFWILRIPVDDIGEELASDVEGSPALINLDILPSRNPETFYRDFYLLLNRVRRLLQSVARLQRLTLPMEFISGDPWLAEKIFGHLLNQPYLQEVQLSPPTVPGFDEDDRHVSFVQDTLLYWSALFKFEFLVPFRFIRRF
ncbi:hypothetical protein CVT26_010943 [Gymnopilus dilepis]|uniref:Uncharacterized protein n=1 Tax=Gymnopilus dilepis TaxID=231916 RepID=A0A409VJ04_9AGAR|nr:hypothetical protein CVT26_010943 [Gymnopilus dilepis]